MSSHYIHGTDVDEQSRLSTLNSLLNDRCLQAAQLQGGEAVVDFGSGLGQFSRAMARVTGVAVVGLERSPEQIEEARRQAQADDEAHLLDLRQGDVSAPPLDEGDWGRFDVAHTRFLLEHVRNPLPVVQTMVRAVRPGGRVILSDDDFDTLRLWPEPPGFATVWNAHNRAYDRHGNDPHVGRRLVQLLHQAGAAPRFSTLVFFGSCAGDPNFAGFANNLVSVLREATDDMVSIGLARNEVDRALAELEAWSLLPDVALWYGLYWADGLKR